MFNQYLVSKLVNKITFVTGNGKNVGKTTFLNYLLPQLRDNGDRIAYLTVGIDGEKEDLIFGTPKPGIIAEVNDYIVTCDSAATASDANFEVAEVFPFSTELGKLLLLKTLRAGSVELIGPENNMQLNYILNYLKEVTKINTVLIDGAVNRITQIASASDSEFIYIMKVSAKNIMKSVNQIKMLSVIKNFPLLSCNNLDEKDYYLCEGALTNIKASKIPERVKHILINDFTKIFLTWNELSDLLKNRKIYYEEKYHLCCISVNLYDTDKEEFTKILSDNNIKEEIVFNPYEYI
ncbi:MAG TPA: hypothetical protein QF753_11390 [Victivallales bacterium]|nr:hypothetical protein [Victivallales bacterium]